MGITSILNIAKNAMFAQQFSIQVASHNIANVNTKGYCRQIADLREGALVPSEFGFVGTGVTVAGFVTYFDRFLENTIANRNTSLEQQSTSATYFSRIETILNENNSNLAAKITNFFNGWSELSADPTSYARRSSLAMKGENLARTFNNLYNELNALQKELDHGVEGVVAEINRLTAGIADLNEKIIALGSTNGEDAAYVNQRAQLIKELSGKINITSFEDQAGGLTVITGAGKTLVERNTSWKLTTQQDPSTGFKGVFWEDGSGNPTNITGGISGGKIKALIDMRDKYLENGFIKDLDELAKTIITEVNTRHMAGYNQNGTTGIAFFKEIDSNFARDMDLSSDVKNDVSNIAAASAPGEPSGNDMALQIASLIDQSLAINGQTTRMTTYVSSMMGNVGELTRNAQELSDQHQSAMTIMEKQRESVSGVSIDEEMTNLLKYQYAYQAAARLITVADEMFRDLLGVIR
jgi:flagellar hook-associated protein 1 FlgK